MFKKKAAPNLSHSQQLEAITAFAGTIGDVMAICSVSAKRKGEKLKKRFVVILKEKKAPPPLPPSHPRALTPPPPPPPPPRRARVPNATSCS